ncbi:MAG: hypothetical protein Q7S00_06085, partial [bacterium]|nr:hypothetical protein [bacterium]
KMRVLSTGIPSGCVLDERSRGEDPSPPASFKILCRQTVRNIINSYIHDLATETERRIGELKIQTVGDIRKQPKQIVGFSEKFREKNKQLKKFLFENMYRHPRVEERAKETNEVIIFLFHHYLQKPTDLPAPIVELMKTETPERVVCDYIAGMTDRFALAEKTRLSTQ